VLLEVLDLLVGGLKPAKRLSKLPTISKQWGQAQTMCGSTPGAEAHPMTYTGVNVIGLPQIRIWGNPMTSLHDISQNSNSCAVTPNSASVVPT